MRSPEAVLARACQVGDEINRLQARTDDKVKERRRLWLVANRVHGLRYQDLAQACGVSRQFIDDQLRRARREHPDLAKTNGTKR